MHEADVNTPSPAYELMAREWRWDLLDRLSRGTIAMQEAGATYLPQFEAETSGQYRWRLDSNILYEMFADAVETLESKPFSKPVTWEEDGLQGSLLPELPDDIDGLGTTLTQFASSWFRDALMFGLGHALVDFTHIPENETGTASKALEEARGARVNVLRITPPNLIDWQFGMVDGKRQLSEVRIRNSRMKREGFRQETVKQVIQYGATQILIWEQTEKGKWEPQEAIANKLGRVPLVTWYTNRTGVMQAKPPLLKLAEANLDHWQVHSDFKLLEHIVSIATFFTSGFSAKEKPDTIGPMRRIHSNNEGADAKWVEHSGAGIKTLADSLQKIEDRGQTFGGTPTSRSKSPVTATGEIREVSDAKTNLHAWALSEEDALERVFRIAAEYSGVGTVSDDFAFTIYKGFTIGPEREKEIDQMQADAMAGRISTETYLRESTRRGLYSDDLDIEEELGKAEDEAAKKAEAFLKATGGEDPFAEKGGDDDADDEAA